MRASLIQYGQLVLVALLISGADRAAAQGQAGTTLVAENTAQCFSRCDGPENVQGVLGAVCVTNGGERTTSGLTVANRVQHKTGAGPFEDLPGASSTSVPSEQLGPGEDMCYDYEIVFPPDSAGVYRVASKVTILNHSGRLEEAFGPEPKADFLCDEIPPVVCEFGGCTLTQGFWKNHPGDWPVDSLDLGGTRYTKAQLLSILRQPVKGNGLVSLAHQLAAAKLNAANGASCPAAESAISSADAQLGSAVIPPVGRDKLRTSQVNYWVSTLDDYNNGQLPGCAAHCDQ